MGGNAGKGSMHQRPLIFKARVHLRASRRLLAWPLFLTLLALPTLLPWPWGTVEFEEFALLYGAFLAPLMAAWVVPRLILADPGRALVASTRSGLPRIAIEKLGVLLGFFGVLWTLFLGVAWGTYSIRILDSDQFPVGLESVTRLWTSGTAGILFFTACSFLLSSWSGVQAGGLLATGLWIVGIYVGRSSLDASVWTPFLGFFDLYHDVFWGQHGLLAALALILLYVATRMSRMRSAGPGRRTPWLTAVRPETATEDAASATMSPRRGFRTLVRLEWHWALRRKTLWVYTGVLTGLLLILFAILPATPDVYLTDVMPSLLFVSPLLLTLFVASAFSRNDTLQYDWYWCTPAVWTKALWAKLAAHGTLALALTTALAMATIVSLVLRDGWPWRDMAVLMVPFWALTVVATLGQVLIVVGLTLILRHTLVVLAVVCTLAVGLYLGFLTPTLTLLDLRDHTLASLFFSPITGFAPDFQAAVRLVLLYLSGGLLLWIAALLLFPHWEHRATWTRTGQWSMVALAGAGGLLVLGVGLWFHGAVNAGRVPRSITVPEDVWTVRAVEYHAQFRDGVLTAESRLELVLAPGQTSDAIVLRLNPGLQLQEVTLADRPVSWERQPESVYLSLPAAVSADGISLSLRQRHSTSAYHQSGRIRDYKAIRRNFRMDESLVVPPLSPVALFDDMITTGSHFKAAKELIGDRFPTVPVYGVFIARRIPGTTDVEQTRHYSPS